MEQNTYIATADVSSNLDTLMREIRNHNNLGCRIRRFDFALHGATAIFLETVPLYWDGSAGAVRILRTEAALTGAHYSEWDIDLAVGRDEIIRVRTTGSVNEGGIPQATLFIEPFN